MNERQSTTGDAASSRTVRTLPFVKMHGIGNDYVFVNAFERSVEDPAAVARAVSDRHFGVGSDGLILMLPSDTADLRMRIFNADGSEGEMCGNGIRCVAKYAYESGLACKEEMRIETLAGIKAIRLTVENGTAVAARVDMGEPMLKRSDIPMTGSPNERVMNEPIILAVGRGRVELSITCVSMGNPHAVAFVEDVDAVPLAEWGPALSGHPAFPERTNAHFVQVLSRSEVKIRPWERGSGPTLACGTGACAVCVAGALTHRTDRIIVAHLPGGHLELEWARDGHVHMTGPAEEAFRGEWPL